MCLGLFFLIMDMVTKTFGAKASIKLNLFGTPVNAIAVIFLGIIASLSSEFPFPGASTSFNAVFGFRGNGVRPGRFCFLPPSPMFFRES